MAKHNDYDNIDISTIQQKTLIFFLPLPLSQYLLFSIMVPIGLNQYFKEKKKLETNPIIDLVFFSVVDVWQQPKRIVVKQAIFEKKTD